MPAVSQKQQKFFGIVRAIQKGEMAPTTPETAKAAADMKKKDVKDFASTKHKGLPEKKEVKEALRSSLLSDPKFMKKIAKEKKEQKPEVKKTFSTFNKNAKEAQKRYEVDNKKPFNVHRNTTYY
jgi:hypothetical protein